MNGLSGGWLHTSRRIRKKQSLALCQSSYFGIPCRHALPCLSRLAEPGTGIYYIHPKLCVSVQLHRLSNTFLQNCLHHFVQVRSRSARDDIQLNPPAFHQTPLENNLFQVCVRCRFASVCRTWLEVSRDQISHFASTKIFIFGRVQCKSAQFCTGSFSSCKVMKFKEINTVYTTCHEETILDGRPTIIC